MPHFMGDFAHVPLATRHSRHKLTSERPTAPQSMQIVQLALFVLGAYPLACAWQATRGTALLCTVYWGVLAWLGWGVTLIEMPRAHPDPAVFVALCLTGCAGVAVFGARRPQAMAWNFVVLGLLAVMVLPLIESALIGARSLDGLRLTFLGITLAVSVLNYLPTRFGLAAFLVGLACGGEMIAVAAPAPLPRGPETDAIRVCFLAAPWLALWRWTPVPTQELDRTWREFRDRWGVVWGQRVREQFNRAAVNAGWPVTLAWQGFIERGEVSAEARRAMHDALTALLKRFDDRPPVAA